MPHAWRVPVDTAVPPVRPATGDGVVVGSTGSGGTPSTAPVCPRSLAPQHSIVAPSVTPHANWPSLDTDSAAYERPSGASGVVQSPQSFVLSLLLHTASPQKPAAPLPYWLRLLSPVHA